MEIYFIIIILSLLSAIAFHKKKLWVWSAPILFLITELFLVFFELVSGTNIDKILQSESRDALLFGIPTFFGFSLLFSGSSALANHLKTK